MDAGMEPSETLPLSAAEGPDVLGGKRVAGASGHCSNWHGAVCEVAIIPCSQSCYNPWSLLPASLKLEP